jgi:hypothetical protein
MRISFFAHSRDHSRENEPPIVEMSPRESYLQWPWASLREIVCFVNETRSDGR